MNRKSLRLACLLVGTVAIGCGSGKMKYAEAGVSFDAPPSNQDAPPGTDSTPTTDAGAAPMPGAGSKLVVGGEIQLIGSGPDTCTNQVPATTDRWCGFAKPSSNLGFFELWVINVTKVAANVPVKCDTTDANCLRLSTGLYADPTNGFRVEGFDGDTLTYSEEPSMGANGFIGTVSAWHPGWTAGRPLTSNAGIVCNGHHSTHAAVCIENPVTDGNGNTTAELHAGFLDDQNGGPLPIVDTLLVVGAADAAGVQKWSASLTPDGASVAWSTRVTDSGTENLQVQTIGDDTSRVAVASDVSQWIVTADSAEWLWLQGYNYDQNGMQSGTLQSAAYPKGTGVQTIAPSVGDFNEAGSKGVLYRAKLSANLGELHLTPDRDVPATTGMLDTGVFFVFEVTQDGQHVTYTKNVQSLSEGTSSVPIFDLWVSIAAGTMPCALASTAIAFLPPNFLSAGDMAAWGRLNTLTGEVEGVYTTVKDCMTRKFASDVFSWTPIADEGYVFLDTLSPDPTVSEATLRYAKVANGLLPAAGTSIQTRAGLTFSTLLPSVAAVVYTVQTGATTSDGLYVNATLPFTTTPVATPTDGGPGTDATTGSDTGTDVGGTVEAGPAETAGADAGADADADNG